MLPATDSSGEHKPGVYNVNIQVVCIDQCHVQTATTVNRHVNLSALHWATRKDRQTDQDPLAPNFNCTCDCPVVLS